MFNVRLIKAEGIRRILVLLFYIAVTGVSIRTIINREEMGSIGLAIVWLFMVPFLLWFELKRYIYVKANDELNKKDMPEECLKHTRFVIKSDFLLKQYQNMAPFQEGYALLDLDRADEVKSTLEERFKRKYEYSKGRNFEHSYLLFQTAAAKGDRNRLKENYEEIEKIFSTQQRLSGDLITLRHYIEAVYLACTGEAAKAIERFELLDTNAFKRREMTYYNYFYARACQLNHDYDKAEELYRKAVELSPNNVFIRNHPITSRKKS